MKTVNKKRLGRLAGTVKDKIYIDCHFEHCEDLNPVNCEFINCTTDGTMGFHDEVFMNYGINKRKIYDNITIVGNRGKVFTGKRIVFDTCVFSDVHFGSGIYYFRDCHFNKCTASPYATLVKVEEYQLTPTGQLSNKGLVFAHDSGDILIS